MGWKPTAFIVALLVLGTAGCGGGSSSGGASNATNAQSTTPAKTETQTTPTTPRPKVKPPKEPFARQVFDACQKREAALAAFTRRAEAQKPKLEIGDLGRAFPAIETTRITELEAITPPARWKSRFEQLKAALSARRDELAEWAKDNPTGTISRSVMRQVERSGNRATALGTAMKLTCSI
jgi:hypothetical protein